MKAVVAAFNQEKALVGAFSVITNLRMELLGALVLCRVRPHRGVHQGGDGLHQAGAGLLPRHQLQHGGHQVRGHLMEVAVLPRCWVTIEQLV